MAGLNIPSVGGFSAAQFMGDKEGLSVQFEVVIPGFPRMLFKSCEGMDSEIDVIQISEGGRLGSPLTSRGGHRASRITFGKGTVAGESGGSAGSIFKWYMDVCDASKPLQKKMIVISLTDAGKPGAMAKWNLVNAWPCRWVGPLLSHDSSDLTMEYLSFAHEGITAGK